MYYSELLFGFYIFIFPSLISSQNPEVTIEQGRLKGLYQKTLIGKRIFASFEKIPYAKPPIANNRFKEPIPPTSWNGILDATAPPPRCLQAVPLNVTATDGSEDCLYMNVYTPKLTEPQKELLDVIVFVHGGGYEFYGSKDHTPKLLLDRDIVFVTFDYRIGPLGFFSTGDDVAPGNYGLKDQILALKWVQKNILAFGGNPKSVTIAGFSSGSASCHYLLLSPLSKGLFKGAILTSGVALNPWAISENPRQTAIALANKVGCPTDNTAQLVKCLREKPAESIVTSTHYLRPWPVFTSLVFSPVVEPASSGAFISQHPEEIIKQKHAMDVPILLSYTPNEGFAYRIISGEYNPAFYNDLLTHWDELLPVYLALESIPSSKKPLLAQKTKEYYKPNNSAPGEDNLLKLLTDEQFVYGIGKTAKYHASLYKSPVYLYRFSYRGEHSYTEFFTKMDLGVSHGDDTLYLVGSPLPLSTSEKDIQMTKQMVDMWVSFAAKGSLNWQPMGTNLPKITYRDIKEPGEMEVAVVNEIGEEHFWDTLLAEVAK